jgi:choline dehydrogenase
MGYDVVIAGAGAAGCVAASRLSEDPKRSVFLLEAGPDYPDPTMVPPEILSIVSPAHTHDWGYTSEPPFTEGRCASPAVSSSAAAPQPMLR